MGADIEFSILDFDFRWAAAETQIHRQIFPRMRNSPGIGDSPGTAPQTVVIY
jgi:hypothetical protein